MFWNDVLTWGSCSTYTSTKCRRCPLFTLWRCSSFGRFIQKFAHKPVNQMDKEKAESQTNLNHFSAGLRELPYRFRSNLLVVVQMDCLKNTWTAAGSIPVRLGPDLFVMSYKGIKTVFSFRVNNMHVYTYVYILHIPVCT